MRCRNGCDRFRKILRGGLNAKTVLFRFERRRGGVIGCSNVVSTFKLMESCVCAGVMRVGGGQAPIDGGICVCGGRIRVDKERHEELRGFEGLKDERKKLGVISHAEVCFKGDKRAFGLGGDVDGPVGGWIGLKERIARVAARRKEKIIDGG
jgi:hypothetical protein